MLIKPNNTIPVKLLKLRTKKVLASFVRGGLLAEWRFSLLKF